MKNFLRTCYFCYKSTLMTRNTFFVKVLLGPRRQTFGALMALEILKIVGFTGIFSLFLERMIHINARPIPRLSGPLCNGKL